ncbi:hypothetical protein [Nocardia tengchongensis]|uniref:hypothetical protein n=1 Tax=Nocardia tengchongensis TaxID=2055889 RepID=UPI00364FEB3B
MLISRNLFSTTGCLRRVGLCFAKQSGRIQLMAEQKPRPKTKTGRPRRAERDAYTPVGARIPESLHTLITEPVGSAQFPTLKSRVVQLVTDGLETFTTVSNPVGVIYPGKKKPLSPVDLPDHLADRITELVDLGAFTKKTSAYIELLHRGLAVEKARQDKNDSVSIQALPIQPELPLALARTGT